MIDFFSARELGPAIDIDRIKPNYSEFGQMVDSESRDEQEYLRNLFSPYIKEYKRIYGEDTPLNLVVYNFDKIDYAYGRCHGWDPKHTKISKYYSPEEIEGIQKQFHSKYRHNFILRFISLIQDRMYESRANYGYTDRYNYWGNYLVQEAPLEGRKEKNVIALKHEFLFRVPHFVHITDDKVMVSHFYNFSLKDSDDLFIVKRVNLFKLGLNPFNIRLDSSNIFYPSWITTWGVYCLILMLKNHILVHLFMLSLENAKIYHFFFLYCCYFTDIQFGIFIYKYLLFLEDGFVIF